MPPNRITTPPIDVTSKEPALSKARGPDVDRPEAFVPAAVEAAIPSFEACGEEIGKNRWAGFLAHRNKNRQRCVLLAQTAREVLSYMTRLPSSCIVRV
jgi:hypothetical protein